MKIYSLVRISYDWCEYHEFILSTTKKEKIYEAIGNLNPYYTDSEGNPLKIYFQDNEEDVEKSNDIDESHWFVHVNEE